MDKKEPKNPDYTPFDGLLKHLSDQFAHKEMKVGQEVESWVRWKEIWLPGKYSVVQ